MTERKSKYFSWIASAFLLLLLVTNTSMAHCDGLDGPVVKDARKALETGNINLVLKWVKKDDQKEITTAFNKTLSIRKLSPEAKEMADYYFFETLVRIHRAGEGAPFTGLKEAGRDLGPAIPAADKAIETGSPKDLVNFLNDTIHKKLHKLYTNVMNKKNFDPDNVKAGREYVAAYVEYVHFVEKVFLLTSGELHGDEAEQHAH